MAKTDCLQTEQEHQKRAFEHYAAQSGRRSYRATAEAFGVSVSTVKLWSRSFGWHQRLHEHSAKAARETADRVIGGGLAEISRNRKIVQMALVRLAKGIAEGKVKMQLGDLDRLIRLQAFIDDVRGAEADLQGIDPFQFARLLYERFEFFMSHLRQQSDEWVEAVSQEIKRLAEPTKPAWCESFTGDQTDGNDTPPDPPATPGNGKSEAPMAPDDPPETG